MINVDSMDREFAVRLVVFEYLLPMQRDLRVNAISSSLRDANITHEWAPVRNAADLLEHLLILSDSLLGLNGFPTSYIYPVRMMYDDSRYDDRQTGRALIDAPPPFVWNPQCPRPADPKSGFRTFNSGPYMSSGILVAPAS